MARGRHTKRRNPAFLRDLSIMGIGVVVVALLVFGALWVIASIGDDDGDGEASTTTTSAPTSTSTSSSETSSTSSPETTTTTEATTTTTVASTTTVTLRDPSEVHVIVLNSVGIAGLAGGVTEELDALGYETSEPDNYSPLLERSRIWYREGYGADALELGAVIEDALIQFDEAVSSYGDVDIVIVLGTSYEG